MSSKITVPLDISNPIVLRRLLVEIVEHINIKTQPLTIEASATYSEDDNKQIISKINEIIDKI